MTEDHQWVDSLNMLEFANNLSFHCAVSQPPFYVICTYYSHIRNGPQEAENHITNQWATKYQKWFDLAWKCLVKTQESMQTQMKCTPTPSYKTGQHVWLSTKSWQLQILEVQWIGLFEIQKVLHNACHLHLLSMLKIHPMVNIAFLKPMASIISSNPRWTISSNPQDMADKEWDIKMIVTHKCQGL